MSEREAFALHAEVKALQIKLGLSYKDAAHRLYQAATERFETEKNAEVAITSLLDRLDKIILHEIYPPMTRIDKGDFDEVGAGSD